MNADFWKFVNQHKSEKRGISATNESMQEKNGFQ